MNLSSLSKISKNSHISELGDSMPGRFEDRNRGMFVPSRELYYCDDFSWWGGSWRNMKEFEITVEEFEMIYDSDLLWEWDEKYNLILDDYEEGVIESDLSFVRDEIFSRLGNCKAFEAFSLACDLDTGVLICL